MFPRTFQRSLQSRIGYDQRLRATAMVRLKFSMECRMCIKRGTWSFGVIESFFFPDSDVCMPGQSVETPGVPWHDLRRNREGEC
jgi:hypothetical protein